MPLGRSLSRSLLGCAALAAIGLTVAPASATPDTTVFHGGTVFTSDDAHPYAQAVAIRGDRVVEVGSDAEVLAHAGPHATRIDLGGRALIPGFNDAHVHVVVPEGAYLNAPDFIPGPGPTLANVQGMIAGAAAATPPGTWLMVFIGSAVFDDPAATRFALDPVSAGHPVALFAWTGHGTWLNTAATAALGIGETEPDPFGGHFARVPGSDVITGEAHEYAEFNVRRRMLSLLPDAHLTAQYQAFLGAAAALGYTSLQDMAVGVPHARAIAAIRAADPKLRVRSICFPLTPGEACGSQGDVGPSHDRLSASGVKWIADGTPVERLAFVETPYVDRPGWSGAPDLPSSALRAQLDAHRHGPLPREQMLFHAVGDAAIGEVLDAMEDTGGAHVWEDRRTRIEHGDLLFPWDFVRARDLGVVVVQNPTHFTLAPVFAERFTPAVFAELEPMASLLAEQIPLAIGTDGIGAPQPPLLNVFLATIHPTRPSEALTVEQAIVAFTRGAAYAEMSEHRKGMLKPGYDADLVVLSQDIFHQSPLVLLGTGTVLTMVGGEVVFDAGALPPDP
ncbi:MAG: amidohydrolase family protein [Byssovorax sp.]